jgi:hypothetical protein
MSSECKYLLANVALSLIEVSTEFGGYLNKKLTFERYNEMNVIVVIRKTLRQKARM